MFNISIYDLCFFSTDTDNEVEKIISLAKEAGAFDAVPCTHYAQGGLYILLLTVNREIGDLKEKKRKSRT